jgi:hypothetical protein
MPSILVIDATNNARGFEAKLTRDLVQAIQGSTDWTVADVAVAGLGELATVDTSRTDAVLLVAHGDGTDGGQVAEIDVGDEDVHWHLAASALNVHGKALLLAVCEGLNPDAVAGVLREQFPAAIVGAADGRKLTAAEALKFFPRMLAHASGTSPSLIATAARQAAKDTGVPMHVWEAL